MLPHTYPHPRTKLRNIYKIKNCIYSESKIHNVWQKLPGIHIMRKSMETDPEMTQKTELIEEIIKTFLMTVLYIFKKIKER